jgi:two-component system nitrogen regulation sensor histidine kinase GlnL
MTENSYSSIFYALPQAVLLLSADLRVEFINQAAEDLLAQGAAQIIGKNLQEISVFGKKWADLCTRAAQNGEAIHLLEQQLEFTHENILVSAHITSMQAGKILLTLEKQDGVQKLASWAAKNEITRATGVMAAMLAHEVKNPLSGIRGAAQLLQAEVTPEQQPLASLICKETDRIRDLLEQMEIFTAGSPELSAVNIHEVLQYVISVAKNGFARDVSFRELYDPSLPPVLAHRDLLVQMFLNLVKNAAEAVCGIASPTITISTYYQTGYRLDSVALPIAIDIEDNGAGIAENLRENLFEPFLSSKEQGRGLGLAIVAKIAKDLGASVENIAKKDGKSGAKFTVRMTTAN